MAQFIQIDNKFIPYGILHYYSSGQTCEEAVASLLRSHEKNPKLFPRVHAQEVEFWYESFKNENYDFSQSPTLDPSTKLENLPVLHHVFHRVNAADQQSLLKTCKQFNHMIKGENRLYEQVEFRMSNSSIMLQVTCGIDLKKTRTVYKKNGEGCIIIKDTRKTESEKDFMGAAFSDFSKTVEMIHTKVKKLTVKYSEKMEVVDRIRFMTGVSGILSGLKEKLHVEDLEMGCHEPHELESILKTLKPKILTKLRFSAHRKVEAEGDDNNEEDESNAIFKIKESPVLKEYLPHITILRHSQKRVDLKLEDFAHTSRAFIEIVEMTPEDVKAHREKLLQSPNFENHRIYDLRGFRVGETNYEQDWVRAMKPFKKITEDFEKYDEEEVSGTVPYEDGTGDVLYFEVKSTGIAFRRKSKKRSALLEHDSDMEVEDEGKKEEEEEKKE